MQSVLRNRRSLQTDDDDYYYYYYDYGYDDLFTPTPRAQDSSVPQILSTTACRYLTYPTHFTHSLMHTRYLRIVGFRFRFVLISFLMSFFVLMPYAIP